MTTKLKKGLSHNKLTPAFLKKTAAQYTKYGECYLREIIKSMDIYITDNDLSYNKRFKLFEEWAAKNEFVQRKNYSNQNVFEKAYKPFKLSVTLPTSANGRISMRLYWFPNEHFDNRLMGDCLLAIDTCEQIRQVDPVKFSTVLERLIQYSEVIHRIESEDLKLARKNMLGLKSLTKKLVTDALKDFPIKMRIDDLGSSLLIGPEGRNYSLFEIPADASQEQIRKILNQAAKEMRQLANFKVLGSCAWKGYDSLRECVLLAKGGDNVVF
jgi:hypothetical protein